MRHLRILSLLALVGILGACSPDGVNPNGPSSFDELTVPVSFDYQTVRDVAVVVKAADHQGQPARNALVQVYDADPRQGGNLLAKSVTNAQGRTTVPVVLATYRKTVFVSVAYPGLPNLIQTEVAGGQALATVFPGAPTNVEDITFPGGESFNKTLNATFAFIGTFNNQGVPDYLTNPDSVPDGLLDLINTALPERSNAFENNPTVLQNTPEVLRLNDSATVWVTFLHEGASFKNTFGYYTFQDGNAPATPDDIDTHYVVFPNASLQGSGGGMTPGMRVELGQFSAGTNIGWFVLQNAWKSNGTINESKQVFYSQKSFNPEDDSTKRNHTAMLFFKDPTNDRLVLGMEDIENPPTGKSDQDFNDVVFYFQADPIEAIDALDSVVVLNPNADKDGDGVIDDLDDYPLDPERAFTLHFPGETAVGTIGFEDLWPGKGDYDMNDVVMGYNYTGVANADNEVVELTCRFSNQAIGASFVHAFCLQFPIAPTAIASVTGQQMVESNYLQLNANGTEANQSMAVVPIFDNSFARFGRQNNRGPINTMPGASLLTTDTQTVVITFSTPQPLANLGPLPFNPFIITTRTDTATQRTRGIEVHLPGGPASDLADPTLFNNFYDATDDVRMYSSKENHPWGIHLPIVWNHPLEGVSVLSAYPTFASWAMSAGIEQEDWYLVPSQPDVVIVNGQIVPQDQENQNP